MMKNDVFELLQLRYEWEELARGFKLGDKSGHLDNLKRFVQTGHKANRFRDGHDRAVEIANLIIAGCPDEREEIAA
jgi:hypothetical protein